MADPRVMTLPPAPLYRDGGQPQSALGVFIVGDATAPATQTARLIDFNSGTVIGLAEGDETWNEYPLQGYQPFLAVGNSTPLLFSINGPDAGAMLLMPGTHYFQALPPAEGEDLLLRIQNLSPAPAGFVTVNWTLPPA